MKYIYFRILLLFVLQNLSAQSKRSLMQGIWEDIYNGSNKYQEINFSIQKGDKSLSFGYTENSQNERLSLYESIDGFMNYNPKTKGILNINELKEDGEFYMYVDIDYVDSDENVKFPFFQVPEYFYCDDNNLSIGSTQSVKIERLPSHALKSLYNRGIKDNRNYIKDYLGIEVKEIKVAKSLIYSKPDVLTNMNFIKGDIVTVLEEKDEWVKIEFLGVRLVTGWIKASDVQ